MAGLRTPGEPPAIWVCEISLIAGTPLSTQEQSCDGFVRPGACLSRPWPQPGESKLVPTPGHRWHAGSVFGAGPRRPLDREQRARFRALLLLNRRPRPADDCRGSSRSGAVGHNGRRRPARSITRDACRQSSCQHRHCHSRAHPAPGVRLRHVGPEACPNCLAG